ncbi:MAG: aminoacyl-tRNA hydrolase [Armatimonadota bacterium]
MSFFKRLRTQPSEKLRPEWLVAGLGNPGPEYAHTRHNAGFDVIHHMVRRYAVQLRPGHDDARLALARVGDVPVVLSTPITFMNRSGVSISKSLTRYKLGADKLIVLVDDVALPIGRLRIRSEGSAGGHNGLKSIIATLGTQEFIRIRVGVGDPGGENMIDHVLGPFSGAERQALIPALHAAADAVEMILSDGVDAAMNKYNNKSFSL